jgi:hypothetical protein
LGPACLVGGAPPVLCTRHDSGKSMDMAAATDGGTASPGSFMEARQRLYTLGIIPLVASCLSFPAASSFSAPRLDFTRAHLEALAKTPGSPDAQHRLSI